MKILSVFLLFFTSNLLFSQTFSRLEIPFEINDSELKNPLAGGLNSPQFSSVDLNNDNKNDLYIFDRIGNVHLTFLNVGGVGEGRFEFAPEYQNQFPRAVNFVLLRDFNGDQIADFFAHSGDENVDGIKAFRGFYENNKIAFERVEFDNELPADVLAYPIENDLLTQIPVDGEDYPDINDADGDGDLDVLNFLGGYVQFYQNMAVESGLPLDSLVFELTDECWGRFFEPATSSSIKLSDNPDMCAEPFVKNDPENNPHPGSTLLTFDEDGDGDSEIIIGDSGSPFLNRLVNGGDMQTAFMTDQDPNFPSEDFSIFLPFFVAPFYLDLNNDGKKDLIAAPNNTSFAEDTQVAWFYENTGTAETPIFEFQQSNFLVEDMLDFGTNSYPTFADVTGDGLTDLVVGNGTFYQTGGIKDSRLFLFENIGSANNPKFQLTDDNWLNFSQFNNDSHQFTPTFGDLDNDGDLDLLVGENFGSLFFSENEGGEGNPMIFNEIQPFWEEINVGQLSAPQIADMNRDGLPDLVLGERNGNLNYFQNIGTLTEPEFENDPAQMPNNSNLGNVDLGLVGSSKPVILDFGNEFKIVAGSESGGLYLFENIENNLDGNFDLIHSNYGNIREGVQTAPAVADLNNDGILDMIIGNRRGGLSLFKTNLKTDGTTGNKEILNDFSVRIFPNPARDFVQIELRENGNFEVELFDVSGRNLSVFHLFGGEIHQVTGSHLMKISPSSSDFPSLDEFSSNNLIIGGLDSGFYFFKVRDLFSEKIEIHKIIFNAD